MCVCVWIFSFAFLSLSLSFGLNSHLWIFDTMCMGHLSHFIWFLFFCYPMFIVWNWTFALKTRIYSLPTYSVLCHRYLLRIEIENAILIYHSIQFTFLMQTNWNLVSKSGIILKRNHQIAMLTVLICIRVRLHCTKMVWAELYVFEEIPDRAIQLRNRLAYYSNCLDYYDIQFNPSVWLEFGNSFFFSSNKLYNNVCCY